MAVRQTIMDLKEKNNDQPVRRSDKTKSTIEHCEDSIIIKGGSIS